MGDTGAQSTINPHGSCRVYFHARSLQADLLRIGTSPGGYQELFGGERLLAAVSLDREDNSLSLRAHPAHLHSGDNAQAFLPENLDEGLCDFWLVAGENAFAARDEGHFRPKAGKHLAQFEGDVAAAQDEQRTGLLAKFGLPGVIGRTQEITGEVRDIYEARHVRNARL